MVQKLMEAMEYAEPDPDDPTTLLIKAEDEEIQSYYGAYVDSLAEAIIEVENWVKLPVAEWPKNYNKPVDQMDEGINFEIRRL